MANGESDRRPHLILNNAGQAQNFTSPKSGRNPFRIPVRDRALQAASWRAQLNAIAQGGEPDYGLLLEFQGFEGIGFATESLSRDASGIELLNVRTEGEITLVTVYVPEGKLAHFEGLVEAYMEERRDSLGRPRDHRTLVDAIREIRRATLRALWTDSAEIFPTEELQIIAWEIWLPVRGGRAAVIENFLALAAAIGFDVSNRRIEFAERTVLLCRASRRQLESSVKLLSLIAEVRKAKESADFFDSLNVIDQQAWLDDLLARTSPAGASSPFLCVLDTGVNRGHALLSASLSESDLHAVEPSWGVADTHGHGTGMAGIALYGDLTDALQSTGPVQLNARLESVKLLDQPGSHQGEDYGALTQEAVARAEITAPNRSRVFNLAVTATDTRDRGRPSSWSASVDSIASDWAGDGVHPRLLVVSAGNSQDPNAWSTHPTHLATEGIHDPGQAWNCLTVGAYTDKIVITEPDAFHYQPIAAAGSLSPFTSTSVTWTQKNWPWKPDLVLEGGNAGKDATITSTFASLSLLTTNHVPSQRQFTTSNATSAATALASNMAARILAEYPAFWPETVRALMIHSARWTDRMRSEFFVGSTATQQRKSLVQHCGYGVPDVSRALWSAADSLTLVIQSALQPFGKVNGKVTTRDMHLHEVPWPKEALESLGELEVSLRITLSYFIEPNPGARGAADKYAYQSHALRFEVRRPDETTPRFLSRINRLARDEEEGTSTTSQDSGWEIGDQLRRRGSVHSDVWHGSAAELASRGVLAIYPAIGWWRRRTSLERYDRLARYTLLVSIEAPESPIDLYSIVEQQISVDVSTS
jgi:hypothetical protein